MAVVMDPAVHKGWWGDLEEGQIEHNFGIRVTGLWILLEVELTDQLASELVQGTEGEEQARFGREALTVIQLVHDSIVDFARNEHGQYWLAERVIGTASLQQELMHYETRIQTVEGWKLLQVARDETVLNLTVSRGIGREDWDLFEAELRSRGRFGSPPHRRLVANALALNSENDLRSAIVEAVAAWEMVLSTDAAERLTERHIAFTSGDWKVLIERAGLRASTRLVFGLLADIDELSRQKDSVIRALELRNNVIHNGQHRLDPHETRELIYAIRAAIRACEGASAVTDTVRWNAAVGSGEGSTSS